MNPNCSPNVPTPRHRDDLGSSLAPRVIIFKNSKLSLPCAFQVNKKYHRSPSRPFRTTNKARDSSRGFFSVRVINSGNQWESSLKYKTLRNRWTTSVFFLTCGQISKQHSSLNASAALSLIKSSSDADDVLDRLQVSLSLCNYNIFA